jgi:hypothetical protein
VEQALLEGATANGFIGELWTLGRVALMIQRLTGVQHHPVARFGVTHVLAAVPGDRSDPTLRIRPCAGSGTPPAPQVGWGTHTLQLHRVAGPAPPPAAGS